MRRLGRFQYQFVLTTLLFLFTPLIAYGDGQLGDTGRSVGGGEHEGEDVRDERLPPVIPGEELRDGKKTIKVWSTAGRVSAGGTQQAPPCAPAPGMVEGCSEKNIPANVIVDGVTVDERR